MSSTSDYLLLIQMAFWIVKDMIKMKRAVKIRNMTNLLEKLNPAQNDFLGQKRREFVSDLRRGTIRQPIRC